MSAVESGCTGAISLAIGPSLSGSLKGGGEELPQECALTDLEICYPLNRLEWVLRSRI